MNKKTRPPKQSTASPADAKSGKLQITQVPINKLKHPSYNPRKISHHNLEHLKKSLKNFDAVEPAVVNMFPSREHIIVGGSPTTRCSSCCPIRGADDLPASSPVSFMVWGFSF